MHLFLIFIFYIFNIYFFIFILDLRAQPAPCLKASTCNFLVCAQWPIKATGLNLESIFVIKCVLKIHVLVFFKKKNIFVINEKIQHEIAWKCICTFKITSSADLQRLEVLFFSLHLSFLVHTESPGSSEKINYFTRACNTESLLPRYLLFSTLICWRYDSKAHVLAW